MPTHVAFLRAINLGARRKFSKDDIRRVTEAAGFTDVETHINTGNVRLTSSMRSGAKVAAVLEAAYLADRGFEVRTIVFSPAELRDTVAFADALWEREGPPTAHYVSLLSAAPDPDAVAAAEALEAPGERVVVQGRAAHLVLGHGYGTSRLATAKPLERLGLQTSRNLTVVRAVTQKWC